MADSERWTGFSREPMGEPPWRIVLIILTAALLVMFAIQYAQGDT